MEMVNHKGRVLNHDSGSRAFHEHMELPAGVVLTPRRKDLAIKFDGTVILIIAYCN